MRTFIRVSLIVVACLALVLGGTLFYVYRQVFAPTTPPPMVSIVPTNDAYASVPETIVDGSLIVTKNTEQKLTLFGGVTITVMPSSSFRIVSLSLPNPTVRVESGRVHFHVVKNNELRGLTVEEGQRKIAVSGTLFAVEAGRVLVYEGGVNVTEQDGSQKEVKSGEQLVVRAGAVATEPLPVFEQLTRRDVVSGAVVGVQEMRAAIIAEHASAISLLERASNVSHADVVAGLSQADLGNINVDEILTKVPKVPPFLSTIAELTKEIQHLNSVVR